MQRRQEGFLPSMASSAPAAPALPPLPLSVMWGFAEPGSSLDGAPVTLGESGGPIGRSSGFLPMSPAPEPSPAAGHWVQGAAGLHPLLLWPSCQLFPGSIHGELLAGCRVLGPCRDPEQETNDLLRMCCLRSTCSAQMKLKY